MKLTPEEMARIANEIAKKYGAAEESIVRLLMAYLMDELPTNENIHNWQMSKLLSHSRFRREITNILKRAIQDVPDELNRYSQEAMYAANGTDEMDSAFLLPEQAESLLEKNKNSQHILTAETIRKLEGVHTTMLTAAQQAYRNILNQSGQLMQSGTSPSEAMRIATRELARSGLPGFFDKSGRRWNTQSAVEMILRTHGNNLSNEVAFNNLEASGSDLLIVSSHLGARPKCALVQGKIFSYSGAVKTTKDKHGNTWQVGDWNQTSYGEPDGILGINCRHHIAIWYDGKSENLQKQYDYTENAKRYKQEQTQRRYERDLRQAKRNRDIAKEIGDENGTKRANATVRARSARLRQHIDKHGLRRSKVRERVVRG